MNNLKLKTLSIVAISLASALATNISKADDAVVMEQVGHINYAKDGQSQRQVASATTVISKIYRNKAVVEVSQSFANNQEQTIDGEYFFPLPYNSNLLSFQIDTDYEVDGELPDTTVSLSKNDQLKVAYGYELVDDSSHHASVMGFPAKANLPLIENTLNGELVAKK